MINEIETMLPLQLFAKEWSALADSKSYRPRMINFELLLPRLFALLHAILIGSLSPDPESGVIASL